MLLFIVLREVLTFNARIKWVDYAKGISMMLVVLHHAISRDVDSVFYSEGLILFNDTLKLFRMPLFFFLSGLFIYRSLQLDLRSFFQKRIKNLLFVYTLWNIVWYVLVILIAFSLIKGQPANFAWIYSLYYDPPIYWFLFALIIFSSITYLFKNRVWLIFILSLVGYLLSISNGNHHSPTFLDEILRYYPMYLIGYFFSMNFTAYESLIKKGYSILLPGYLVLVGFVLNSQFNNNGIIVFFFMVLGIAFGISLAKVLSEIKGFKLVEFVGKNTLPIYILHVYPKLALTAILTKIGIVSPIIYTTIQFLVALLLPLLIFRLIDKTSLSFVFNINKFGRLKRPVTKAA